MVEMQSSGGKQEEELEPLSGWPPALSSCPHSVKRTVEVAAVAFEDERD